MPGLGFDTGFLLRSLHGALAAVGRDRQCNTALSPAELITLRKALAEEPAMLRFGVIGAGAVGGYTAGMLVKAGFDVTCIDQYVEHVNLIQANGVILHTPDGTHTVPMRALHLHELQSLPTEYFDIVLVCVKSYDTEWAATMMLPYTKPEGVFVSLQNGINDYRLASAVGGAHRCIGGVVTAAVGCLTAGECTR